MGENITGSQHKIAINIMQYLEKQPHINSCTLHGSLGRETGDEYSDIDLRVDLSGSDNGKIALMLPYILQQRFELSYVAFAPKFAPELYLVSVALSQSNIFHFIDIECIATPHIPSVLKEDIRQITNWKALCTKLLMGCLKRYLRQKEPTEELYMIASQLNVATSMPTQNVLMACFTALHEQTEGELKSILAQGISYLQ